MWKLIIQPIRMRPVSVAWKPDQPPGSTPALFLVPCWELFSRDRPMALRRMTTILTTGDAEYGNKGPANRR
jgi:hypothetical protein